MKKTYVHGREEDIVGEWRVVIRDYCPYVMILGSNDSCEGSRFLTWVELELAYWVCFPF